MAPTPRSLRADAVAAAAVAGALAGLFLTAGELLASQVVGQLLLPPAWLFLLAYTLPAGAVAAGAVEWLRRAPRAPSAAARDAVGWMVPAVLFVYALAVANQNLLGGAGRALAARTVAMLSCAVAAAAAAWALRTRVEGAGPWARLAPLFALVAAVVLLQLAAAPPSWLPRRPAALFLPALAVAAAAAIALALATAVRTVRWTAVLGACVPAAILGAGCVGAWSDRARSFHELPQPPAPADAPARDRPNVVLIVLDTVRAANLSAYGYPRRTSPRLDALAAEGVRYSNATTPGAWSLPGHASLFTGLFPSEHGVGLSSPDAGASSALDAAHVTLAEALAEQGYATAAVSANPLISPAFNLDQGFRYLDARRAARGLNRYQPLLRRVENWLPRAVLAAPFEWYFRPEHRTGDQVTAAALEWLQLRRPPGQPFLLFLNYMDAHPPFVRRPEFEAGWDEALHGDLGQRRVALYDSGIAFADHEVGRLLDFLRAQPDSDRNWIIVTSDHGEMLGEHGQTGHHCALFQELLHVPLIMRFPRAAGPPPGTVDDRPVQLVDIAPRILDALGLSLPGRRPPARASMLAMTVCKCAPGHAALHGEASEAVLMDGYKYVEETGRPPRLFDLRRDPGEQENLSARLPDQQARLRAELEGWRGSLAAVRSPPADEARRKEREEALRSLGYLH